MKTQVLVCILYEVDNLRKKEVDDSSDSVLHESFASFKSPGSLEELRVCLNPLPEPSRRLPRILLHILNALLIMRKP